MFFISLYTLKQYIMAKVTGLMGFTGSLGDLTFYTLNGKPIVRRKSGFNTKGNKKGANYVRTRENSTEFGHCSGMSKSLRLVLVKFARRKEYDGDHQHLVKVLFAIKNLDMVSARGKRHLAQGIQHTDAVKLFEGFSFNPQCSLSQVLYSPYSFSGGVFTLSGIDPADAFDFPSGATEVELVLGACLFNFENGTGSLSLSDAVQVEKKSGVQDLDLQVTAPGGEGTLFYVLKVSFYQVVNDKRYLFKNKECGVLGVLGLVV